MDLIIVGGMGCGKTTLVSALSEFIDFNYIYVRDIVEAEILAYKKGENKNNHIDNSLKQYGKRSGLSRDELIKKDFVFNKEYGSTIKAEIILKLRKSEDNIIDNIAGYDNVLMLKNKGFKVVFLDCSIKKRIERRKKDIKDIDKGLDIEKSVKDSHFFFEIDKVKALADVIIDTGGFVNYSDISAEIIKTFKYPNPSKLIKEVLS